MNVSKLSAVPVVTSRKSQNYKTIIIEGNIGSGKTTFLRHLKTFSEQTVKQFEVFGEPIDRWRSVGGSNLFYLMGCDIKRWSFPFQSYVQLTRLEIHQKSPKYKETTYKLIERSLYSSRYCFVENMYQKKYLTPEEYVILNEWYQYIIKNEEKLSIDLIIYLKTNPEVVYERIQKRRRAEEQNITRDYLEALNHLHDEWLLGVGTKFPIPAPLITIDCNHDLTELKQVYDKYSEDIINGSVFKH